MEQDEQHNPAGRLHEILSRALKRVRRTDFVTAIDLWVDVFEIHIPKNETRTIELKEIISRLLQLDKLINETVAALRSIEGLPDRYFRPFEKIREIPPKSLAALEGGINSTIRAITETDMLTLEFCSERLAEQHAEVVISEDELQAILEEVNLLFDQVKTAEIDATLQGFILDGLESMRRGIYEFRIRGSERLKETVGEIVGSLYVNYKAVEAAGEDESLEKFNKLFNRLSAMVTFANTSVKLLKAFAAPLLPS